MLISVPAFKRISALIIKTYAKKMPDALATEMDRVLLGRTKDMKELTVSNSVVSTQWDNPIAFYFLPSSSYHKKTRALTKVTFFRKSSVLIHDV